MIKFARSFLILTILAIVVIGVLYFFAPLGLEGTANANVVKVNDLLLNDWNQLPIKIFTYNLLYINNFNIDIIQNNTWYIFGLFAIVSLVMASSIFSKYKLTYFLIGVFGIVTIVFGSIFGGGLMIIVAIIGIIACARKKIKDETPPYDYLYREYIDYL